ncbi:MAG: hypothetical protein A2X94_08225 [Bdellovibrionales bacterium GWB1_55_8]|nr:MAG: hypothetical protein A2X94_08225 [Bdellovibrionales bacterium GWB1_55_8]
MPKLSNYGDYLSKSPLLVFLISVFGVFTFELLIMLMIDDWNLSVFQIAALDSTLLSLVTVALFWFVIFSPMKASLVRRLDAEKQKETLQSQLFHSAKLATIGTMAAGIAHEINNPLAIMLGNEELLRERIRKLEHLDPQLLRHLDRQKEAGERIARIVKGLRAAARAETDSSESVDLRELWPKLTEIAEVLLSSTPIQLVLEEWEGERFVQANQDELMQVIANLLSNAKDALKEQTSGSIRVSARELDDKIDILVSDTGSGISKENLARIFDPFYTTKAPGEGTGLGLSISHRIVTNFGGTITVESTQGVGTTFLIRLPRAADRPKPKLPPEQLPQGQFLKKSRVLVADDEPAVREILSKWLSNSGYIVELASDGHDALRKLQSQSCDILITDLCMPGMSGEKLIQTIRNSSLYPEMKIAVITGGIFPDSSNSEGTSQPPLADGYLEKPFTRDALSKLLLSLQAPV